MKCMLCERWSLSHICSTCQNTLLLPQLHKRKILGSIDVLSFFNYDQVESLLLSKHTDLGYYLYTTLAKLSMKQFSKVWNYEGKVVSIGIDDHVKNGYSHTAILNRALKSSNIIPMYGKMRAQNSYQYAGKSLEERLMNPRNFSYVPFEAEEVILVDDIVTTGTTLSEAAEILHSNGKKVLFCLTLTDAENR